MKSSCRAVPALAALLVVMQSPVHAGGTIKIDDTKWVSIGAGLRASFVSEEDAAPNGTDRSNDFMINSARIYINGQVHKNVQFELNTECDDADGDGCFNGGSGDDVRVLDAVAKFEFSELFNLWMGRFLPPSDRSNLSGPYYLNAWNFPIAQAYPAIFAGRDDGAAAWGQVNGGQFKYQAGFFQGTDGGPNQEDNLLFAGRAVLNLWDPEPGYYNSSTYYGAKEILAVGLTYQTQSDAVGTVAAPGDFNGWSLDGLMETTLAGGGVATLETTYYSYDYDNVQPDADGYFILGSYLFPSKIGIGQLQPMLRYENLDVDGVGDTDVYDIGLHYVIDGHNARISFIYRNVDNAVTNRDTDALQIGVQLQI